MPCSADKKSDMTLLQSSARPTAIAALQICECTARDEWQQNQALLLEEMVVEVSPGQAGLLQLLHRGEATRCRQPWCALSTSLLLCVKALRILRFGDLTSLEQKVVQFQTACAWKPFS